jgi:(p)ppGpp synthase/HD superfamily hydrolase
MKQDFTKLKAHVGGVLEGAQFWKALEAMELGLRKHPGVRKDKVTPEFQHQISQAAYATTLLAYLMYPEDTLTTIFLHDIVEDTDVKIEEILERFGPRVATAVELMTNQYPGGVKKPTVDYYKAMILNPIASFAKGCDRMHNHQSMNGVFDAAKQVKYITETRDHILPMLKHARREFPSQTPAYQNVKSVLQVQMEWVEAWHGSEG